MSWCKEETDWVWHIILIGSTSLNSRSASGVPEALIKQNKALTIPQSWSLPTPAPDSRTYWMKVGKWCRFPGGRFLGTEGFPKEWHGSSAWRPCSGWLYAKAAKETKSKNDKRCIRKSSNMHILSGSKLDLYNNNGKINCRFCPPWLENGQKHPPSPLPECLGPHLM